MIGKAKSLIFSSLGYLAAIVVATLVVIILVIGLGALIRFALYLWTPIISLLV